MFVSATSANTWRATTGVCRKKRKISKTRTLYNIRDAKHKPSCMRAQAGLTFFFQKSSILREGTALWWVRAYKPRIETQNISPRAWGLRQGLRFFQKSLILREGTPLWRVRASPLTNAYTFGLYSWVWYHGGIGHHTGVWHLAGCVTSQGGVTSDGCDISRGVTLRSVTLRGVTLYF